MKRRRRKTVPRTATGHTKQLKISFFTPPIYFSFFLDANLEIIEFAGQLMLLMMLKFLEKQILLQELFL